MGRAVTGAWRTASSSRRRGELHDDGARPAMPDVHPVDESRTAPSVAGRRFFRGGVKNPWAGQSAIRTPDGGWSWGRGRRTAGAMRGIAKSGYAGRREPYAGRREPYAGRREPYAGRRQPYAGRREPYAGRREPYAGRREPYAGRRHPYAGRREPYAGRPQPVICRGVWAPDGPWRTSSGSPSPSKKVRRDRVCCAARPSFCRWGDVRTARQHAPVGGRPLPRRRAFRCESSGTAVRPRNSASRRRSHPGARQFRWGHEVFWSLGESRPRE